MYAIFSFDHHPACLCEGSSEGGNERRSVDVRRRDAHAIARGLGRQACDPSRISPARKQRDKLRRGVEILERQGIKPRVWIAPGNTFDATTVALLPEVRIRIICDGYFRFPYVCANRMTWVPQQLHYFRPAPAGVWTVCYHPNEWNSSASRMRKFRAEVDDYGANIASLEDVLDGNSLRESKWSAWFCTHPRLSHWLIRGGLKLWSWWSAGRKGLRSADMNAVQPSC